MIELTNKDTNFWKTFFNTYKGDSNLLKRDIFNWNNYKLIKEPDPDIAYFLYEDIRDNYLHRFHDLFKYEDITDIQFTDEDKINLNNGNYRVLDMEEIYLKWACSFFNTTKDETLDNRIKENIYSNVRISFKNAHIKYFISFNNKEYFIMDKNERLAPNKDYPLEEDNRNLAVIRIFITIAKYVVSELFNFINTVNELKAKYKFVTQDKLTEYESYDDNQSINNLRYYIYSECHDVFKKINKELFYDTINKSIYKYLDKEDYTTLSDYIVGIYCKMIEYRLRGKDFNLREELSKIPTGMIIDMLEEVLEKESKNSNIVFI